MKNSNLSNYLNLKLTDHHISTLTLQKLEEAKNSSPKLKNFFGILNQVEDKDFAVFGGAVRDWCLSKQPKDIDIVLNYSPSVMCMLEKNFHHKKSYFNGYQFSIDGINLDVWRLQDSWCFKQGHKEYLYIPNWSALVSSTPFDIDSILVFKNSKVIESGFYNSLSNKTIELKNPINKNPKLFIVQRALRFKAKYGFELGPKLKNKINELKNTNSNFVDNTLVNDYDYGVNHMASSN